MRRGRGEVESDFTSAYVCCGVLRCMDTHPRPLIGAFQQACRNLLRCDSGEEVGPDYTSAYVSCGVLQFPAVCCSFLLCVEIRPGPLNGAFRQAHGIHSAVIRVKGGVHTLGVGVCVAECCSATQVWRVRAVSRERVRKLTECKRNITKQRANSFSG